MVRDHIKEYSENIVKTKLDVLFQYITEDEAVKIFQETKEELDLYKMGYNTDFQLYLETGCPQRGWADYMKIVS